MDHLFRSPRKDVQCNEDLEKTNDKKCGSIINIERVPQHLHGKLFSLVSSVHLQKIVIKETFDDTMCLSQLFSAIKQNRKIKCYLELDVRENKFNKDCAAELTKLISRNLIKQLRLPPIEEASWCEDILGEFLTCGGKIEVLDISGSVISDLSINCLVSLIEKRVVTNQLFLKKCQASNGLLTENDYDKLERAKEHTRRMFETVKLLKIFWFEYSKNEDSKKVIKIDKEFCVTSEQGTGQSERRQENESPQTSRTNVTSQDGEEHEFSSCYYPSVINLNMNIEGSRSSCRSESEKRNRKIKEGRQPVENLFTRMNKRQTLYYNDTDLDKSRRKLGETEKQSRDAREGRWQLVENSLTRKNECQSLYDNKTDVDKSLRKLGEAEKQSGDAGARTKTTISRIGSDTELQTNKKLVTGSVCDNKTETSKRPAEQNELTHQICRTAGDLAQRRPQRRGQRLDKPSSRLSTRSIDVPPSSKYQNNNNQQPNNNNNKKSTTISPVNRNLQLTDSDLTRNKSQRKIGHENKFKENRDCKGSTQNLQPVGEKTETKQLENEAQARNSLEPVHIYHVRKPPVEEQENQGRNVIENLGSTDKDKTRTSVSLELNKLHSKNDTGIKQLVEECENQDQIQEEKAEKFTIRAESCISEFVTYAIYEKRKSLRMHAWRSLDAKSAEKLSTIEDDGYSLLIDSDVKINKGKMVQSSLSLNVKNTRNRTSADTFRQKYSSNKSLDFSSDSGFLTVSLDRLSTSSESTLYEVEYEFASDSGKILL